MEWPENAAQSVPEGDSRMSRDTTGPPGDLDTTSKALYRKTKEQLEAQGTWESSDRELLARYIRSLERARIARDALRDEKGRPRFTCVGSQGQLVQHPDLKTAREAERDAHEYAKELLLTPAARKRAEVEVKRDVGKFGGVLGGVSDPWGAAA